MSEILYANHGFSVGQRVEIPMEGAKPNETKRVYVVTAVHKDSFAVQPWNMRQFEKPKVVMIGKHRNQGPYAGNPGWTKTRGRA